jgi:hypothetical protein
MGGVDVCCICTRELAPVVADSVTRCFTWQVQKPPPPPQGKSHVWTHLVPFEGHTGGGEEREAYPCDLDKRDVGLMAEINMYVCVY